MTLAPRHDVMFVAALAVLTFGLAWPSGWTASTPLPWDEAGHYRGALEFCAGISEPDPSALRASLFAADQYPPGHSIALGSWMAVFGPGVSSWLSFGLMVYVLTAVMLARLHPAAGLLFVGLGMFGGLAPSLMVEPLAVLWIALALTANPRDLKTRGDRIRFAIAWLAAFAALMTKYNFGLPLVGAMALGAAARWERRTSPAGLVAAALCLAGWAAFLSVQDQGWAMFRAFATNRANSIGASPVDRLAWYLQSFRDWWLGSAALGFALAAGLVLVSYRAARRWQDPRFVAPFTLFVSTLTAFSLHPYLLGRNLVVVVASAVILIGYGLNSLGWSRRTLPVHATAILIGLICIAGTGEPRARLLESYYPPSARELEPVSEVVTRNLVDGGQIRVVGSFNEFSPGWMELLRARHASGAALTVDASYPGPRGREELDPAWDPAYAAVVGAWAADGTRRVIALELTGWSPYLTADYERWGRWKSNLARALRDSEEFVAVAVDTIRTPGVVVSVFEPAAGRGSSR